ncbi:hypothetical protein ACFL1D_00650 [Candidatus Omnitrophota bacterium]
MKHKQRRYIYIYLLIFLVAFFVLTPMIVPRTWPVSHEGTRYIILLDYFKDAVSKGVLYPRWLPDAYGGYGYPLFLFYQPGLFFAALPFYFLPGCPLYSMYIFLIFLFFAGGVGAYKLCKELSGHLTGLVCSILFLLTPYLYVNLYVRGDLSELMAMLLCPWPVFFLVMLKKRIQQGSQLLWSTFGIAFSVVMIIISHPAVSMFFLVIFSIIAIYFSLDMGGLRIAFLSRAAVSVMLGAILSSPYWFTIFQMKNYVNLEPAFSGSYYSAELHTVYPLQLFSRFWGFGPSNINTPADGMSFQLGLPHFILATAGFFFGRKKRIIQVSYALYIAFIFLMTQAASALWKEFLFLRYVQFPWRILSVTALLQVICISGLKKIIPAGMPIRRAVIIISALLGVVALWHSNQFQISKGIDACRELRLDREHRLERFQTYSVLSEFIPKTALGKRIALPRGDNPMLVLNPPGEIKEIKGNSKYRIRYQINCEVPTDVLINQVYMPGWRVIVDGEDIPASELERHLTIDGRMQFSLLPREEIIVQAFYDGPPGWRVRNLLIGVIFLGFAVFCCYDRRQGKTTASR